MASKRRSSSSSKRSSSRRRSRKSRSIKEDQVKTGSWVIIALMIFVLSVLLIIWAIRTKKDGGLGEE